MLRQRGRDDGRALEGSEAALAEPAHHPAERHGVQASLTRLQFAAELKTRIADCLGARQTFSNPLGGMQREMRLEFSG